ncbi:uncharacterized protein [Solanum lycopersicum]|uniref:uncharacterized protein n=1 Tax=Solanum lycopersicum TaxID=4081 RepID=UPI003749A095
MRDNKPSIEHQRRLNPPLQMVVKKEIIKLLDVGVIYPITNSSWVCPIQCVPNIGGMTMVPYAKNELVPIRPVTRWRIKRKPLLLVLMKPSRLRSMMSIFSDMVEDTIEVFMDDFSMIGIALGSHLSEMGIDADRAKVKVIEKLPPPISVKGKVSPDWSKPFEVMCDASGFDLDVVLEQRRDKIFHPIFYASKALNEAQKNYTMTEQELPAFVFAFEKFRSYLLGTTIIVHPDQSDLRY